MAAAYVIAKTIHNNELTSDHVIPSALDKRVVESVAYMVSKVAMESGVAKDSKILMYV